MGITVAWEDEQQTIIRLTYEGVWENEEFRNSSYQSMVMMRSVNHPVYVINDFTKSEMPPLGVLWQARSTNQMRPSNWGGGVAITSDSVIRSLIDVFIHVYMLSRQQRDQFVVSTNEAALEIIARLKRENRVS